MEAKDILQYIDLGSITFLSIVIILIYLIRIYKLKGISKKYTRNRLSRKITIFRLTLLILIFLTLTAKTSNPRQSVLDIIFEEQKYYYLVFIACLVLLFQIIIIPIEKNKYQPLYCVHKLFWVVLLFSSLFLLIIKLISDLKAFSQNVRYLIFQITQITLLMILNIYTFFFRKQDIPQFEQIPFLQQQQTINQIIPKKGKLNSILSLIESLFRSSIRDTLNPQMTLSVSQLNEKNGMIQFRIEVKFAGQKGYMTKKKSLKNFLSTLQKIKKQVYPDEFVQQAINLLRIATFRNCRQKLLHILNTLSKNYIYYSIDFLDFLDLDKNRKHQYKSIHHDKVMQKNNSKVRLTADTDQFWDKGSTLFTSVKLIKRQRINKKYYFFFKIKINSRQSFEWEFADRYSVNQFDQRFYNLNKYLKQVKLIPPQLPQKILIQSLQDRGKKLEFYLIHLLNDRCFFRKQVFDFVKLPPQAQTLLLTPIEKHQIGVSFSSKIRQTFLFVDQSGDTFTVYQIMVSRKKADFILLRKRFKQFVQFDKLLEKWMYNNQIKGKKPLLPSKFKITDMINTIQRGQKLINYLNEVLNIENVMESFAVFCLFHIKEEYSTDIKNVRSSESLFQQSPDKYYQQQYSYSQRLSGLNPSNDFMN